MQKGNLFKCPTNTKKGNSTKVHSVTLGNDDLSSITNRSIFSGQKYYRIGDFIEIDTEKFVKILKKLTNVSLEDEKGI